MKKRNESHYDNTILNTLLYLDNFLEQKWTKEVNTFLLSSFWTQLPRILKYIYYNSDRIIKQIIYLIIGSHLQVIKEIFLLSLLIYLYAKIMNTKWTKIIKILFMIRI